MVNPNVGNYIANTGDCNVNLNQWKQHLMIKLNQQLRQVEVKNLNISNDIIFDYFDRPLYRRAS